MANKQTSSGYELSDVKDAAAGHWPRIVGRVGGVGDEYLSTSHGPCPMCKGNTRWRVFDDFDETGGAVCSHCGKFGDGIAVIQEVLGIGFLQALKKVGDFLGVEKKGIRRKASNKAANNPAAKANRKPAERGTEPKPEPKRNKATEQLEFDLPKPEVILRYFTYYKKTTQEAVKQLGGVPAKYRDRQYVVAFPIKGEEGGPTIGRTIYDAWGGCIPKWNARIQKEEQLKVKTIKESDTGDRNKSFGYIGNIADTDTVVWKTEGLPDALALAGLGLPAGHAVCCNACGAGERPDKPDTLGFMRALAGKEVIVVHDCDEPGQKGAMGNGKRHPGWAPEIAKHAKSVRNVVLPYPIEESKGKDLKDWIEEQKKAGLDPVEIYEELFRLAMESPLVLPAGESPSSVESNDGDEDDGATLEDQFDDDDEEATDEPAAAERLEAADDPNRLAVMNMNNYRDDHGGELRFWRQQWWKYREGVHRHVSDSEVSAKVHASIRREFESLYDEELENYNAWLESPDFDEKLDKGPPKVRPVKRVLTSNVIDAMKSLCLLSNSIKMPCWLPDRTKRNYLSMKNGMLSFDEMFSETPDPEKILLPHSADWFSPMKLPYDFDHKADCPIWKAFLEDVFNQDRDSIVLLQQWFGYMLLPDTSQQKMLFVIGQKRSGKGTIMRALMDMLGRESVANPCLGDLANQYALQGMMDKSAAIIGDLRLSGRVDDTQITEKLLAISGEDALDVQRKYLETIHSHKFNIRFTISSNMLPKLSDSSAALMSRFLFLSMPNTYYGREDRTLGTKVESELPGILNWAIAGRASLTQVGEFIQPESGKDTKDQMQRMVAPVSSFMDECCALEGSVAIEDLHEAWCNWARENHIAWKLGVQAFSQKVRDAIPGIRITRPRTEMPNRPRHMEGISLKRILGGES
ncbi:hypothetical protein K227x_05890 [Rubripirellula lacrimiformis]|uniref:SF3 helicase domain-containing protein n=1 Tax=Rubripirellula lacrimiformis TaxID=1930273 RepID=A0A517N501_9BACT|nr:phage/plasmid primase, P4 family [Rubripirellula lacrimiformis]QDT02217.1 hypothetical protein K227x_05890 [Rubripirellula lacrimiformis]